MILKTLYIIYKGLLLLSTHKNMHRNDNRDFLVQVSTGGGKIKGMAWGGEGHALSRKCCQHQSSSPDENDRRQPEKTAPCRGPGRGCTLQSPKFLGSPHKAKASFVLKVRSSWPAVVEFRYPAPASSPDVRVCTAKSGL